MDQYFNIFGDYSDIFGPVFRWQLEIELFDTQTCFYNSNTGQVRYSYRDYIPKSHAPKTEICKGRFNCVKTIFSYLIG